MGKIFPLSEKPSCYEATIKLIECAFDYKKPNSFEIDFAPLMDYSNHHNCFIMLDENENVMAHVGAKDRNIILDNEKFNITMLGGIAVDQKFRGEGHFQTLLQDVLAEKRSDTTFFLLWSDKEKLYEKYGFYLCGTQYEIENDIRLNTFEKTKYHLLSNTEKEDIHSLYQDSFAKTYLTLTRTEADWKIIEKIISADLFLRKKASKITDYYFKNKGQDLTDIIYEYGSINDLKDLLKTISHFGKVWTSKPIFETESLQYQFLMSSGDLRLFTQFVHKLTKGKISIRNINIMKQEIYFDFNEELLGLDLDDFFKGILGPGTFEELDLPSIYLSGLESV